MDAPDITEGEICKKLVSGEWVRVSASNRKSVAWDKFYFIVDKESGMKQNFVQCKNCKKLLPYKGSKSGTSDLNRHQCPSAVKTQGVQPFFKPHGQDLEGDELLGPCLYFVAKDVLPLETLAGDGFLNLADALIKIGATRGKISAREVIPRPNALSSHIEQRAMKIREKILQEIGDAMLSSRCAATTCVWTDALKEKNYMSVTVHYIKNWKLISRVLFTVKLTLACNFEDVEKQLLKKFVELGCKEELVKNVIFVIGQNLKGEKYKNLKGEKYKRFRCAADVLNNVLEDVFKTDILEQECVNFFEILNKTKSLVNHLKDNGLDEGMGLVHPGDWNSTFDMLNTVELVFHQFDRIYNILKAKNQTSYLAGIRKDFLNELIMFYQPFKEAIQDLAADSHPTSHLICLHYCKLKEHLSSSTEGSNEIKELKKRALRSFSRHFGLDIFHKIAVFLHPKYRQLKMLSQKERNEVLSEVRKEISVNTSETASVESNDGEKLKRKAEKFFKWEYNEKSEQNEVEEYQKSPLSVGNVTEENLLDWWKINATKYPKLASLAEKYFAVPATSSSFRRIAGNVLSLNPKVVDNLLLLHENLNIEQPRPIETKPPETGGLQPEHLEPPPVKTRKRSMTFTETDEECRKYREDLADSYTKGPETLPNGERSRKKSVVTFAGVQEIDANED